MTSPRTYDLVGLGVSTLDLLMVVDEFPGQEAVQRAEASTLEGGGPVATAMVTAARLGARTAMVDRVGDDWRGKLIVEEFQHEGVSTEKLAIAPGRSSSIASILVRKGDGARTIVYSPGDAEELSPADLPPDLLSCRILHVNGRHLDACLSLAASARKQGVLVSFDGGAHRFRKELVELIKLSDICIVAREFAFSYADETGIRPSAAKLMGAGPGTVVITGGIEGSWVFGREGESFQQPAFQAGKVVDTTGAGDAYHGAFLFGIVQGYTLKSCAMLASAVAAMSTRKVGGRSGLPTLPEVEDFLRTKKGSAFQPTPF